MPAERAPAGPNRPRTQFRSPGEMPEAHAKHAHNFFFGHVLGPNGTAAHERANEARNIENLRVVGIVCLQLISMQLYANQIFIDDMKMSALWRKYRHSGLGGYDGGREESTSQEDERPFVAPDVVGVPKIPPVRQNQAPSINDPQHPATKHQAPRPHDPRLIIRRAYTYVFCFSHHRNGFSEEPIFSQKSRYIYVVYKYFIGI